MAHNELGFFQFDNLVRNRISFTLLLINITLDNTYSGLEKDHLSHCTIRLANDKLEDALVQLSEKGAHQQDAIIVMCKNGIVSASLAAQLEESGFINVYYITGGQEGLLQ